MWFSRRDLIFIDENSIISVFFNYIFFGTWIFNIEIDYSWDQSPSGVARGQIILHWYLKLRKKNMYRYCKIILYCQLITTIFFALSPYLFYMKWKVEILLLVVTIKLIYPGNACSLNSLKYKYFKPLYLV
jgi:hypothetical protein